MVSSVTALREVDEELSIPAEQWHPETWRSIVTAEQSDGATTSEAAPRAAPEAAHP